MPTQKKIKLTLILYKTSIIATSQTIDTIVITYIGWGFLKIMCGQMREIETERHRNLREEKFHNLYFPKVIGQFGNQIK
jgi:hypothetical protein